MTISLRLSAKESELIKQYADMKHLTVSELIRQSVIERIEDEIDLKLFDQAFEEYEKDPVMYSLEEVKKELNLA